MNVILYGVLGGVTLTGAVFIAAAGVVYAVEKFDRELLADFGPDTDPASAAHRPETETA